MSQPLVLSRQQSRKVDRLAIDQLGMHSLVLMENAGRGCASLLERLGIAGPVAIFCGKGNNGGDGFVIARHLAIRGHEPRVVLVPPADQLTGDALANYRILQHTDVQLMHLSEMNDPAALPELLESATTGCDWLVDCLLGTGATGAPRAPYDKIIEWMNAQPARRLAIDVPSGLDCDTGEPSPTTLRATATATFVASKVGYETPEAREYVGDLHVVGIGIPPTLLDRFAAE